MKHLKLISALFAVSVMLVAFQNCSKGNLGTSVFQRTAKNLLTNAGFENGSQPYALFDAGAGSASVIPEAAHSGNVGLRLHRMTVEVEDLPALSPGKVYLFSFWARVVTHAPDGAAEPWPYMSVTTWFANNSTQPATIIPETANKIRVQSSSWERYEYAIEPGQLSGHTWQFGLSFSSGGDTNNVVDLDDLFLEEVIVQ